MFDWTDDITETGDRSEYIVESDESLEEDTDKEAHVPASVSIIDCCLVRQEEFRFSAHPSVTFRYCMKTT